MNGVEVQGLIDSGCNQTLVGERLVGTGGETGDLIYLQYIPGDIRHYPMRDVKLTMQEHTETAWSGVAKDLTYLVILGHDWRFFEEVVKGWRDIPVTGTELETVNTRRRQM